MLLRDWLHLPGGGGLSVEVNLQVMRKKALIFGENVGHVCAEAVKESRDGFVSRSMKAFFTAHDSAV